MVYQWLKNAQIFPPRCLLCAGPGADGLDLCPGCRQDLPVNTTACCHCATPLTLGGKRCGRCQAHPPPFQATVAPFLYAPPLDWLIWEAKFHGQLPAARLLGQLLAETLAARETPLPQVIVPVPLHPTRLRERGFNQALEVARPVARSLGLPVTVEAVARVRATLPQSGQDRTSRRRNLRGAFSASGPLPWRQVAILDDVITTTATVTELAITLHKAGVEEIQVWCCARTGDD
ncbi:MAG: ComF family protein [Candidatus Competibacteraceae bacterium]|nr:ComF family protein [Candidatus Competibacteraceae bacterium]